VIAARGRTRKGLLAAFCATAAFGAAAGSAQAAPTQRAVGNFVSGPFHAQFHATRAANAPATSAKGDFSATSSVGPLALMTVGGPITCLDVVGNRVGLFYPITRSSPSLLSMLGSGVFLYAQIGPTGQPQSVTFAPVPFAKATSCAPLPALLPITSGTLSLTP
jgi:hypothetical protein